MTSGTNEWDRSLVQTGTFRAWYRDAPFFRLYIAPFIAASFALVIPLFYHLELFTPNIRLLSYLITVLFSVIFSVAYRNLERGEEIFFKKAADHYKQIAEKSDLSLKEQIRLGQYFKLIVSEKSDRFADAIQKFHENNKTGVKIDKGQIFETITQPKNQIDIILKQLGHFFEVNREHRNIEVILFRPNRETKLFEHYASYPKDAIPTASKDEFHLDRGVCGKALEHHDMAVVQDIATDLKSGHPTYYAFRNSPTVGSIVCCPVVDGRRDTIPFVLSIYIDEPNIFLESATEHLKEIIYPFNTRILMEERLRVLKDI